MKLNQLAIAAFAASMAVAYAGGDKQDDKNKKMSASGDVTAENAAAPAGYADKSVAGTKKSKQKDTTAGQAQSDAGLGGTPTARNSGAPAGYSDQSTAASAAPMAGDTQAAQVQRGTGAAADTSLSSSTTLSGSTTSAPDSAAPAGYSDKASSLDGNAQGDTKGAQAK